MTSAPTSHVGYTRLPLGTALYFTGQVLTFCCPDLTARGMEALVGCLKETKIKVKPTKTAAFNRQKAGSLNAKIIYCLTSANLILIGTTYRDGKSKYLQYNQLDTTQSDGK